MTITITLLQHQYFDMTMNDIFDVDISVYRNWKDNIGTTCKLSTFLFSTKYKNEIERLRSLLSKEERRAVKSQLPAATISGVFSPTRAASNLQRHSGLICIDIDADDNPNINDWEELKRSLSVLPQIAYVSLSVSKNGLFIIVPLRYPDYHLQQFKALQQDFDKMGITIDKNCSDVCRMRIISYDAVPYINADAIPYERIYTEPNPIIKPIKLFDSMDNTLSKVYDCVEQIQGYGIDITDNYTDWFRVGCSLASLGETGRDIFHSVSSINPKYNHTDTDRKFTNLLQKTNRFDIGTFFYICADYGIKPKCTSVIV